jgi:hypothetical protein
MAQILDLGKIRFNWSGVYNSSTEYEYNDLVKYGPNLYAYTANSSATGVVPTTTANWVLVTEGVSYEGTYTGNTLYYKNDIVTDGTSTFIVINQHTSLATPSTSSNANLQLIALGQEGLPNQSGNIDRLLTTNGSSPSWTATTRLTKGYWGTTQGQAAADFETSAQLTDVVSVFARSTSDFGQLVMVNPSNGANASADVIVYTADGTNDSGWIDLGITSNNFSAETFGITGPHDGYIFMSAPRINTKDVSKVRVIGSTCTITTTVAHGYSVGNVIKLEDIGEETDFFHIPSGLYTLTAVSSTTASFAVTGITPFSEEDLSQFGVVYKPAGDGNLVFATDKTGLQNAIVFAAGGFESGTSQMTITPNEVVSINIATPSSSTTTGALVVDGGVGIGEHVNVAQSAVIGGQVVAGQNAKDALTDLGYSNAAAVFNFDDGTEQELFAQIAFRNADKTSSTDLIVYSDNGWDEYGWASFGITGSDFGDPLFPLTGANDAYIFHDAPKPETATITSKAITSNVATLTVSSLPASIKPGAKVVVTGVDATFNGEYRVTATGTNTFSYAKTNANVSNTAVTPTGTATFNTGGQGNLVFATGANGSENKIIFGAGGFDSGNAQMIITPDQSVHIEIATPSTSPTTGALTVVGGVGIVGDVNIAGSITFGGSGTQVSTANLSVTAPFIFTGDNSTVSTNDLGLVVEGKYAITNIPTASVVNKALTSNVATLTTFANHNFAVGDSVVVAGVDATFNGTYGITAVTATTFSYALTAPQVTSARIGDVSYSISNKILSANVATLTTTATHDFITGEIVEITGVDSTFNGTYTITGVTTNTFSYAKTASNVTSAAVSPTGTATVNRSLATAQVVSATRTRFGAFSKDATDNIWKLVSNISTEPTTSIDYAQNTYGNGVDIAYDTLKLGSLEAVANISAAGTLASTGNFAVNTDKFTVAASSGDTLVAGTLGVTGNTTLTGDLAVNGGDITTSAVTFNLVNGTVTTLNLGQAATTITMGATSGTTTVRNDLAVTGALAVNTNKFNVDKTTGNTTIAGTLGVTGNVTANADLTVTGTTTFNGAVNLNSTSRITGRFDVQEMREDISSSASVSGGVMTISYNTANVFYNGTAVSGNYTVNLTDVPTDNDKTMSISIIQNQGGTAGYPSAFQIGGSAVTIKWGGGTAPSPTANKLDIFNFTLLRLGSAWQVLGSANLNY